MRDYKHWSPSAVEAYKQWMLKVFYPMNHKFLQEHNGACIDRYWANWDLANLASVMALTQSITISNDLFRSARADYMEV
jgi:hypothetical protein